MTDSIASEASYLSPRYAHLPVDCGGAAVRAQCRHLATVVTISGSVNADNLDRVSEHPDKPFVVDLSGVKRFPAHSVRLLYRLEDACSAAGLEWAVLPSAAVSRALLITREDRTFLTVASVHEALHYFADVNSARRRLLLPLLNKIA